MTAKTDSGKRPGFLARLRANEQGNIIALTAAAVLPIIATVGGAIDISRVYAVKARMQAACDAGALSGRKVMGSAEWEDTNAETAAETMFAANFAGGFFASTDLSTEFSGTDEVVTGEVSANVPMTLMRIFNEDESTVSVTCTSEMKIPHTDVMFVLDTTGSMNCSPSDTIATCTNNGGVPKTDARIVGLRRATNCFYESLAKEDTGEVCDTVNGDPVATGLAEGIQLRVGFMPYSSNINVGNFLPTAYFADSWTYQSRTPITSTIPVWNDTGGAETFGSYGALSPATRPGSGNFNLAANYGTWTSTTGTGTTTVVRIGQANTLVNNVVSGATSGNCADNNTIDSKKLRIVGDIAGTAGASSAGTSSAPTYAGSTTGTRTRPHTRTVRNTVTGYRYAWISSQCRLQSATGKTSSDDTRWDQTQSRTGTIPIAWTMVRELTGWTLRPRTFDVSGLKDGTDWNGSLSVPDISYASVNVNRSGANSSSAMNTPTSGNVTWGGCIEERQTFMNTDNNPDDDWDDMPADAFDLDIDRIPDATPGTQWAPALQGLIYSRLDGSGNRTMATSPYPTTSATSTNRKLNALSCPREARKLAVWDNAADIATYTDSLIATGGTYHDIGLLWGARFVSPSGIFGTENSTDADDNLITIQRHMIFMTDGDTGTCSTTYTPYGTSWWDRRQTNKAVPNDDTGVSTCTNSYTNRIVDARTAALCTSIKNKNITLWVISFSAGVNAVTEARLENCASSSTHFYDTESTADLLTAFQEIALQISRLRLQS